jgi:hemolysin activation/secretion protein
MKIIAPLSVLISFALVVACDSRADELISNETTNSASRPLPSRAEAPESKTNAATGSVLPPLSAHPEPQNKLSSGIRVHVREFRFKGNTVFPDSQLSELLKAFAGREVAFEDLEEARRLLTLKYVNAGYINSGAVLDDQDVSKGVITFRLVEGGLSQVNVHGNRWLSTGYITNRLQPDRGRPLDLNQLQDQLQLLRFNPNVSQINAELQPGAAPGEGILDVHLRDNQPFRLGIDVDNHRPPSVGSEEVTLFAADQNVTGHSDDLEFSYGIAHSTEGGGWEFSGSDNLGGSYTVPFTSRETTFSVFGDKSDTSIFEQPFNTLDIKSETTSYGLAFRHPLVRKPSREIAVGLIAERRENFSTLLGEPFDLSPGAVRGEMSVSVLRFFQEWFERNQDRVLAVRSTFNFGLNVLGATESGHEPDAQFFSWLGQCQYVQRLFGSANQLILRTHAQITTDPLLAVEQLSVGGAETVRGYRENQLVRDQGVVSSVEFRVPIIYDRYGNGLVQLAPFFDYGGAWNIDARSPTPTSIYSTGIGLLLVPNRHLNCELYWGHPFVHIDNSGQKDIQDLGIHFKVVVQAF